MVIYLVLKLFFLSSVCLLHTIHLIFTSDNNILIYFIINISYYSHLKRIEIEQTTMVHINCKAYPIEEGTVKYWRNIILDKLLSVNEKGSP